MHDEKLLWATPTERNTGGQDRTDTKKYMVLDVKVSGRTADAETDKKRLGAMVKLLYDASVT